MKKEKDSIQEAYEKMLVTEGHYVNKWERQFYAKKFTPMFLDHRSDFSEEKKEMVQKEKKKFVDDMAKLELSVINAIQKMDKRSDQWDKWLDKQLKWKK